MMKSATLVLVLLGSAHAALSQYKYPFQDPSVPAEDRITNVLSLLTLQEKIDLLGTSLNVERLGIHAEGTVPTIPGSGGQFEGLHGVAVGGPANWGRRSPGTATNGGASTITTTQFPQPAGLGETWDPALVKLAAEQESKEVRFIFQSYDRGGLIVRAPNADLARDPRWGRSEESFSEDPFLTGTMAKAVVQGLQGDDPRYWRSISLVKHFLANSNEDNRSGSSSNFDERLLHEYYAVPFRMAIEGAKANAIMASYNAVNGTPMTTNPLLRTLVQDQWGLNGMIDTDRGALTYMVTRHKFYPDMAHSVAGAIHAGVNQFLNPYVEPLRKALSDNLVTEAEIDRNLRGVFRVLIRAGLLDPPAAVPYTSIQESRMAKPWNAEAVKNLALRLTQESVVLLKNERRGSKGPLLPLKRPDIRTIAVIGPRASAVYGDFYGGTPPFAVSPLAGIQAEAGQGISVRYSADRSEALSLAKSSDVVILVLGNHPTCGEKFGQCPNPSEGKEGIDRKQIGLDSEQESLLHDVYAANHRTVLVLVSGFPYAIDWAQKHLPAIVHIAHSSEEEGTALAEALFGSYNPGGRLVVTWPASLAQLPPMMDYNLRDGRTYMYARKKPLYPFGYGLSYTQFAYSDMRLSANSLSARGMVTVSVCVQNTGDSKGDDVVQLYVRHLHSRIPRPLKELKGFRRVTLDPGERRTIQFSLAASDLAYWDTRAQNWALESDRVLVEIGSSSADVRQKKTINVATEQ